jgi:hypothetical protein
MADEITSTKPLTGGLPAEQSATIQNAKKAQWAAIVGSALAFLLTHVDTIQALAMTIIPPHWYGVVTAAVQLGTAAGAVYFGKETIKGRISATERITVTKKTTPLNLFSFLLFFIVTAGMIAAVAQAQTAKFIDFTWTHETPPLTDGFRLYKGKNVASLVKIAEIPDGAARAFTFPRLDTQAACFGLSAFNGEGESDITYKTDSGVNLCFGKPSPPKIVKGITR